MSSRLVIAPESLGSDFATFGHLVAKGLGILLGL